MTAAKRSSGARRVTGSAAGKSKPTSTVPRRKPTKLEVAVARVAARVGDDVARRELLVAALEVAVRVSLDPTEPATSRSRAAVEVRLLACELRVEDARAAAAAAIAVSPWGSAKLEAL